MVRGGEVWVPAQQIPNLPAEPDAFIGRERYLTDLARALETCRLVSVLGVGGVGKTRLVIRYAWTWIEQWPAGAFFCDLTAARSLEGVLTEVARALGVALTRGDPVEQLGHAMACRGRCLLVLDGFEYVEQWASDTVGIWLDMAADAHLLCTTREVLAVPHQCVSALPPMPVPDGEVTVEEALASPAIQLFTARAHEANRAWRIDDAELAHVVAVVRVLDGIPLAIELAAARLRVFEISQLAELLGDRLAVLIGKGARTDRLATMKMTFDWSWELLDEREREALLQLSSWFGGFTLASAEAVLDIGEPAVDVLARLVDASMLRQMRDGRFAMSVTLQEYVEQNRIASHRRDGPSASR
jgi:predicted ATPase